MEYIYREVFKANPKQFCWLGTQIELNKYMQVCVYATATNATPKKDNCKNCKMK